MISSSSLILLISFLLTIVLVSGKPPKFNYSDPGKWGSLSPEFAKCSNGKRQSPIDINTKDVIVNKTMQPLGKMYHIYNATLSSDGIEVKVNFNGRGLLVIDGKTYNLKQMHWHTPVEHIFNGVYSVEYAAELHEVHEAVDGSRAIVAILLKYGKPDPVLTMLKPQLEELAKNPCQGNVVEVEISKFDSIFLKRRPRNYFRYFGSITTPPCDENVIWNVFSKVKTISKEQVEALKAPLCEANKKKNARPIQPMNGRKVQAYVGN